jgi:class 3 adenylate cyclase
MANSEFEKYLQAKVNAFMTQRYEVQELDRVPTKLDATLGDKASAIQAACVFIDIRNSSALLVNKKPSIMANLLKSFHYICIRIIKENQGEVRSINGDGNLSIFAESSCCDDAVKSGLAIKYYLNHFIKSKYNDFIDLDYGIGIDFGKIFVAKVGSPGEFNNDLIWIGMPINKAAQMGEKANYPHNILITNAVYNRLGENNRYKTLFNSNGIIVQSSNRRKPIIWKPGNPPLRRRAVTSSTGIAFPVMMAGFVKPPISPNPSPVIYHTDYERPL